MGFSFRAFAPRAPFLRAARPSLSYARPAVSASLRAAWPSAPPAPGIQWPSGFNKTQDALGRPPRHLAAGSGLLPPLHAPSKAGLAVDVQFSPGSRRAKRIARGLQQAGVIDRKAQTLLTLPTASVLQGRLRRAPALQGAHLLSQQEWAQIWTNLNASHYGISDLGKSITRLPLGARADFFVFNGTAATPEASRAWARALQEAGVLSRRFHPKSFKAMTAAIDGAHGEDVERLSNFRDRLFVLPKYPG